MKTMAIRARGRSRSNARRAAAEFSARTGHARLWTAFARRADHSRACCAPIIASRLSARSICGSKRSFVLVANHSSHLDTRLPSRRACRFADLHRAFPAAAADYFFKSVPRTWIATVVVNALPFARQAHVRQSLTLCQTVAREFRQHSDHFSRKARARRLASSQEFKPGIGALVAGRDVAVLPCYLDGAFRAWPKGQRLAAAAKGATDHRRAAQLRCDRRHAEQDRERIAAIAAEVAATTVSSVRATT